MAASTAAPTTTIRTWEVRELLVLDSWQFLYFLPLPQGHGSLRPGFGHRHLLAGRGTLPQRARYRQVAVGLRRSASLRSLIRRAPCADCSRSSSLPSCAVVLAAQTRTTLDIYLVDVEGGNATLFVAPSGESLLIDTGNGGAAAARDGDRIMAAVKDAGLSQIDHLITTHYHGDHYGAMENVAGRIPIRDFIDHGPNVQPNPATDEFLQKVYPGLYAKSRHTVVKPGDRIAMKGVDVRVVASAGQALTSALPGAGRREPVLRARTKPRMPIPARTRSRWARTTRSGDSRPSTWAI